MFIGGAMVIFCLSPSEDEQPKQKKIIMKSVNEVAIHLSELIESSGKASAEDSADKQYLFDLLVKALIDEEHPDVATLYYIGSRVIADTHGSDVWVTWFIISLRRIAKNISLHLPEAWFLELSDITDDAPTSTSHTPLMSPILASAPTPSPEVDADLLPEPAINDLSMSSESDSDDSQKLLTEAGPLATPTCPNEVNTASLFTEYVENIAANYIAVNKYIELTPSGSEELLTAMD